jgi:hypothetical protein
MYWRINFTNFWRVCSESANLAEGYLGKDDKWLDVNLKPERKVKRKAQ